MTVEVEVCFPVCTLEDIQKWARESKLGEKQYCQAALAVGAQTMQASLGYLEYLDEESLQEAAQVLGDDENWEGGFDDGQVELWVQAAGQKANRSIRPAVLARIILGDGAALENADLTLQALSLELPARVAARVGRLCEKGALSLESFYNLAFAMGLRMMANTLSPLSYFSPVDLAQAIRRRLENGGEGQLD